jgi:hypothetical protein
VKWEMLLESAATWEDWNVLMERFHVVASWGQVAA